MKQLNSTPTTELMLRETASQTAGPYVHIGLALNIAGLPPREEEIWNRMATREAEGELIEVVGTVIDGNGERIRDAFIEAWQADASGNFQCDYDLEKPFNSFGRSATTVETDGEWSLTTVKPGVVNGCNGKPMAPHINLAVFARGVNMQLNTRLYFEDEADANAACPILNAVESQERRKTLLAKREEGEGSQVRYRFDIRVRGEDETVFFDF